MRNGYQRLDEEGSISQEVLKVSRSVVLVMTFNFSLVTDSYLYLTKVLVSYS